jgi:hypothetical protein
MREVICDAMRCWSIPSSCAVVGEAMSGVEWPLNRTARYDRVWWTEEPAPVGRGLFWALLFVHDAIMRDGAAASGLYLTEMELRWAVVACHYLGVRCRWRFAFLLA